MATMTTPALPTPEALDLADYKLGSFGSDLDMIRSTLEDCAGPEGAGRYDADRLAQIIVLAVGVADYARELDRTAAAIQQTALGLYHEQRDGIKDPGAWGRYQASIRAWHDQEANRA